MMRAGGVARERERVEPGSGFARIAAVAHRIAVLLAGGVPPPSAWSYLDDLPGVASVAQRVGAGEPVDEALRAHAAECDQRERPAWVALIAAWSLATQVGAPLAPTLERFAAMLRSLADAEREVRIALAGPQATVRLVTALPAVGVVLGLALGFDTLGILLGTSLGWACLAAGALLLAVGRSWTRRLVARAEPDSRLPGLPLDLAAIAVSGAVSPARVPAVVAEQLAAADGVPSDEAAAHILAALELSRRAGVPAAALLCAEADQCRREHLAEVRIRVARLGVTLMLPLGMCVFPAFVAVGVVPLVMSVISSTVASG